MLKRQRPATPPPSSLSDSPSFFSSSAVRPLHSHTTDPSQPRSKRPRVEPPPLDGALRGWLQSDSTGLHSESDGEEDWTEEDPHDAYGPPLPLTQEGQYKDTNLLLHELHVLNQHRLLFAHSPRDQRSSATTGLPATSYAPSLEQSRTPWAGELSCHLQPPPSQVAHDEPTDQSCFIESTGKGLVEEVQYVRQRYGEANRLLGSLFLLRRREVADINSSSS